MSPRRPRWVGSRSGSSSISGPTLGRAGCTPCRYGWPRPRCREKVATRNPSGLIATTIVAALDRIQSTRWDRASSRPKSPPVSSPGEKTTVELSSLGRLLVPAGSPHVIDVGSPDVIHAQPVAVGRDKGRAAPQPGLPLHEPFRDAFVNVQDLWSVGHQPIRDEWNERQRGAALSSMRTSSWNPGPSAGTSVSVQSSTEGSPARGALR